MKWFAQAYAARKRWRPVLKPTSCFGASLQHAYAYTHVHIHGCTWVALEGILELKLGKLQNNSAFCLAKVFPSTLPHCVSQYLQSCHMVSFPDYLNYTNLLSVILTTYCVPSALLRGFQTLSCFIL